MVHLIAIVIVCGFYGLNRGVVECKMQGFCTFFVMRSYHWWFD